MFFLYFSGEVLPLLMPMGIVIKDGDYIQENISYRAEDYVSLSNCLVLTRKKSNNHMFWNRKCFSIFFFSSSLTNFCLFTARTKLVHKLDVKQQHENWSSIKPLFLVLIDQVLNGLMPPAENLAILMEILDKKGKKLKFSFFCSISYCFSFFRCVSPRY